MKKLKSHLLTLSIAVALVTAAGLMVGGCKGSDDETPAETQDSDEGHDHSMDMQNMQDQAESMAADMKDKAEEAAESIQQTTCPVMGNEIDKSIFVEYKGQKVYFCCPPCKEKFQANPEAYLVKLPHIKDTTQQ